MEIKFCGLRRKEDIEYFNKIKVSYLGFIFASSKRQISKEKCKELLVGLDRSEVKVVGVFCDQSENFILDIALDDDIRLDVIQLHGHESNGFIRSLRRDFKGKIWKAIPGIETEIMDFNNWEADKVLIDSSKGGGSGLVADWKLISKYRGSFERDFILAGGLNKDNILEGIKVTNPNIVDISSGIEIDGFKDSRLMEEIVRKVKDYEK